MSGNSNQSRTQERTSSVRFSESSYRPLNSTYLGHEEDIRSSTRNNPSHFGQEQTFAGYNYPDREEPAHQNRYRQEHTTENTSYRNQEQPTRNPRVRENISQPPRQQTENLNFRNRQSSTFEIMRKWNLRFSGKSGEDSEEFIRRLQDGRNMSNISDEDLLTCLPFFLEGVALNWYRNTRPNWRNYVEFEEAWRTRFNDPDFQYTLFQEVHRRSQHPKEKVVDYLTCLKTMFNRMIPPIPISIQIDLAIRKMLPKIQTRLDTTYFETWSQLEYVAARIERSFKIAQDYTLPPTPENSSIPNLMFRPEPRTSRTRQTQLSNLDEYAQHSYGDTATDEEEPWEELAQLGFRGRPRNDRPRVRFDETGRDNPNRATSPSTRIARDGDERRPSPKKHERCYRCSEIGHYSNECSNPRRIFCHVCGTRGTTLTTCPKCNEEKKITFCKQCGLVGVTQQNCPECSGNSN